MVFIFEKKISLHHATSDILSAAGSKMIGISFEKKIRLKIEKFSKGVYMFETLWGGSNSGQGMFFAI